MGNRQRGPRFIMLASEFGFGPMVALYNMIGSSDGLFNRDNTIIVGRPAARLVLDLDFPFFSYQELPRILSNREPHRILINFGYLPVLEARSGTHHYVDCVPWLNKRYIKGVRDNVDLMLAEYFPPTERTQLSDSWVLVRPSLSEPSSKRCLGRPRGILLSFGGCNLPAGAESKGPLNDLPRALSRKMKSAIPRPLVVSGGYEEGRILSYKEQLAAMEAAEVVVCQPGLYTVFESMIRGKPVLLLPPMNYSQHVQYKWYVERGFVPQELDWNERLGLDAMLDCDVDSLSGEVEYSLALREMVAGNQDVVIDAVTNYVTEDVGVDRTALYETTLGEYFQNPRLPTIREALMAHGISE